MDTIPSEFEEFQILEMGAAFVGSRTSHSEEREFKKGAVPPRAQS